MNGVEHLLSRIWTPPKIMLTAQTLSISSTIRTLPPDQSARQNHCVWSSFLGNGSSPPTPAPPGNCCAPFIAPDARTARKRHCPQRPRRQETVTPQSVKIHQTKLFQSNFPRFDATVQSVTTVGPWINQCKPKQSTKYKRQGPVSDGSVYRWGCTYLSLKTRVFGCHFSGSSSSESAELCSKLLRRSLVASGVTNPNHFLSPDEVFRC